MWLTRVLASFVRLVKSCQPLSEIVDFSLNRRYIQSGTLIHFTLSFHESSDTSSSEAFRAPLPLPLRQRLTSLFCEHLGLPFPSFSNILPARSPEFLRCSRRLLDVLNYSSGNFTDFLSFAGWEKILIHLDLFYCPFLPFWVDIARNLYWRALEFWRAFRIWRALPWSARRSGETDFLASLAAFYWCGEVQGFHHCNLGRQKGKAIFWRKSPTLNCKLLAFSTDINQWM